MREKANFYSLLFVVLAVVQLFACMGNWPLGVGSAAMVKRLRISLFKVWSAGALGHPLPGAADPPPLHPQALLHQEIGLHDKLPPGALSTQLSKDMGLISRAHAHAASTKCRLVGTGVGMVVILLWHCERGSWRHRWPPLTSHHPLTAWRMTLVMSVLMPLVFFAGYGNPNPNPASQGLGQASGGVGLTLTLT